MNVYNEDGTKKQRVVDADKIKLGQRIESLEARTGEPSAQRLLAERAVEALRAANSFEEAHALCNKANCTLVITDTMTSDGKLKFTGFVKADDGTGIKVKLSALPTDCSYKSLDKRFENKDVTAKTVKSLTANQAKYQARQVFNSATSLEQAESLLASKNMRIERVGKSGGYLVFGDKEEQKMKLSALGGKYSLSALSKKYKVEGSNDNSIIHGSQGKVNASSMKHASNYADKAQTRASSAQERAADVAAEGIQAKTLSEALDDAFAQAFALDAVRKANRVAAVATERARILEEKMLSSQHIEKTKQFSAEDTDMFDFLKKNTAKAPTTTTFERDLLASQDVSKVPSWVGKRKEEMTASERGKCQIGEPSPTWFHKFGQQRAVERSAFKYDYDKMNDFELEQQRDYRERFAAVAKKLESEGVTGVELDRRLFAAGQAIFEEQIAAEQVAKTSTDNDVSKTKPEAVASDTPREETASVGEKQLTLKDRIAEARAKGVFNGGGKPLQTGHSQTTNSSSSAQKAPRM